MDEKRKALRQLIKQDKTFTIMGAFDPICAKLVERHGVPCTYVSGSATAATAFGLPDLGLTSLIENAYVAGNIANAVSIPAIADADTGYGNAKQIPKTVYTFEQQGLAGIHIEDQVFPKRCGHLEGKAVIPEKEMVKKIQAAIQSRKDSNFIITARVDSYSVSGFDDMLRRAQAYADAGADMIFPEAMTSLPEYERVCKTLKIPVLANMTEFGKTPYFTVKQFSEVGVRAVLFPLSVYRAVMKTMDHAIQSIGQHGTQKQLLNQMMSRTEFYELIDYEAFETLLAKKS